MWACVMKIRLGAWPLLSWLNAVHWAVRSGVASNKEAGPSAWVMPRETTASCGPWLAFGVHATGLGAAHLGTTRVLGGAEDVDAHLGTQGPMEPATEYKEIKEELGRAHR